MQTRPEFRGLSNTLETAIFLLRRRQRESKCLDILALLDWNVHHLKSTLNTYKLAIIHNESVKYVYQQNLLWYGMVA